MNLFLINYIILYYIIIMIVIILFILLLLFIFNKCNIEQFSSKCNKCVNDCLDKNKSNHPTSCIRSCYNNNSSKSKCKKKSIKKYKKNYYIIGNKGQILSFNNNKLSFSYDKPSYIPFHMKIGKKTKIKSKINIFDKSKGYNLYLNKNKNKVNLSKKKKKWKIYKTGDKYIFKIKNKFIKNYNLDLTNKKNDAQEFDLLKLDDEEILRRL